MLHNPHQTEMFMSEPYSKMLLFFGLAFVFVFSGWITLVWLVCRCVRTKRALNFFTFGCSIIIFIGYFFATKVMEATGHIHSTQFTKGQLVLLCISLLLISAAFPQAVAFLFLRYFFPEKLKRYWKIKSSFFVKPRNFDQEKITKPKNLSD
jgi:hypothetical protein